MNQIRLFTKKYFLRSCLGLSFLVFTSCDGTGPFSDPKSSKKTVSGACTNCEEGTHIYDGTYSVQFEFSNGQSVLANLTVKDGKGTVAASDTEKGATVTGDLVIDEKTKNVTGTVNLSSTGFKGDITIKRAQADVGIITGTFDLSSNGLQSSGQFTAVLDGTTGSQTTSQFDGTYSVILQRSFKDSAGKEVITKDLHYRLFRIC
jgi:hypothetical protein